MGPVRAVVLKVVDKMADVLVTDMRLVSVTKVSQNLSFENVLVGAITLGTQYLQSIIGTAFTLSREHKVVSLIGFSFLSSS